MDQFIVEDPDPNQKVSDPFRAGHEKVFSVSEKMQK